jgi:hypothetical protein
MVDVKGWTLKYKKHWLYDLMANLDKEDKAWLMQELLKTTGFERNGNTN